MLDIMLIYSSLFTRVGLIFTAVILEIKKNQKDNHSCFYEDKFTTFISTHLSNVPLKTGVFLFVTALHM